MRNNGILLIFVVILLLTMLLMSSIKIAFVSNVKNKDKTANINVKYFFNVININLPIYPTNKGDIKNKNKEKKPEKKKNPKNIKTKGKLGKKEAKMVLNLIKKIKIGEVYININFGNQNISFTSFIYVFINIVYSNLINILNCENIHLNVKPDFLNNYIDASLKIEIKLKIKDIIIILISMIRIYIKLNKNKRTGDSIEINKLNKNSYGNNI